MHYPSGTFSAEGVAALAGELTEIGLDCEKLPKTPLIRSTVWIYANEYAAGHVFVGGELSCTRVISLEVNVFEGGLDDPAKQTLIERFTAAVGKHARIPAGERCPVYVLIRESEAANWGIFGSRTTLEALRNPPPDMLPL